MKRLPAQIGITYFSVLAAAFYLPRIAVIITGGIAVMLTIIFFSIGKIRKTIFIPAMAAAALLACVFHLGYTALYIQPTLETYADDDHTVSAVLTDEAYKSYSKYYYRLRTTYIDGEKVSRKLLLKTAHPLDAEPDDTLLFTSWLEENDNQYFRAKGYYLVCDNYQTTVLTEPAESHSLYYYAIGLRRLMRKTLESVLPSDCAGLCRAVLIGDKYALSLSVRNNFRYAGASYFIVVSGMHFAVISLMVMRMFKRCNRFVRLVLSLLFIVIYAAVTGFQSSVLRSGIMIACMAFADALRRKPYPPNHLGIAGIVVPFFVSPSGVGDVGLILSFYATLSILMWASPIAQKICIKDEYGSIPVFRFGYRLRRIKSRIMEYIHREKHKKKETKPPFSLRLFLTKLWNGFLLMLSVSLAANLMVFPISVFLFKEFSLVTLLSAVLLYWAIYLILILSLTVCVLFWCKPVIAALAIPLMWLCKPVLWVVDGIASLPFAYFRVGKTYFFVWTAVTILLGAVVILYRDHYRYLLPAVLCSAVILLSGSLTDAVLRMQELTLEVHSSGDGICVWINCGGNLHILHMDAKSKELYQVWDDLSQRYRGADTALCCDDEEMDRLQRYGQDEFAISSIMLYDKDGWGSDGENVVSFDADSTFILDDGVILRVSVSKDHVVPYVTADGRTILILPDDCDINDVPEEERSADIIVLSRARSGMETLCCRELIICDEEEPALRTAKALEGCYQTVYMTGEGDVRCRLR